MGKINFTKTILIGIVIAGIIGVGITTAYAGTNINLKGDTTVDGNLAVNGEISAQSETPTQAGDELFRKVVFYKNTLTGLSHQIIFDKDLNIISNTVEGGPIKDVVISGEFLITTRDDLGDVLIVKWDLALGSVVAVERIQNAEFEKQVDIAPQPTTTAAFVVLENECTAAAGSSCSATLTCSGRLIASPACVAEDTTGAPLEPFSAFCDCDSTVDPTTGDEGSECFGDAFSASNPVRFTYRGLCDQ